MFALSSDDGGTFPFQCASVGIRYVDQPFLAGWVCTLHGPGAATEAFTNSDPLTLASHVYARMPYRTVPNTVTPTHESVP